MTDAERQLNERLERLELQVQRLAEHLDLNSDDDGLAAPPDVVDLARAGRRLEAIKLYGTLTGADISTATSIVNAII